MYCVAEVAISFASGIVMNIQPELDAVCFTIQSWHGKHAAVNSLPPVSVWKRQWL